MINRTRGPLSRALLAGTSAIAIISAGPAFAQDATRSFDIPAQPLSSALLTYSRQSDTPVIASMELLKGKSAPTVRGDLPQQLALQMLLEGSGLRAVMGASGGLIVERVTADPQSGSVAGGGAEVEGLIVTAQKREENIQDVPIAMSAFSQEDLERSQVAGGPDLMTQIPNMSFTKTNFTGYSIQIRGIGTQAVSATTDPGVAVAFNNTPFIRNRFFEQEFFDLERVEVLRGPQGTLYGRNATAGVVNIISAKPKFSFDSKLMADVANYNSRRLEGMINFPLVEDAVALRIAGAWTKRNGYALNQMTGAPIDGRDLWSTRVSLRFEPTDNISANLIWEHFEEDDDRLRSSKQLCKKDVVTQIGNVPAPSSGAGHAGSVESTSSQGCKLTSLYSPEAFQTPYGFALPYFAPLGQIGLPIFPNVDPYRSETQSRDLRVIESTVEPDYRAKTDLAELQISIDLTDSLTLISETAYNADELFSLQDYNRFTTTSGVFAPNKSPTYTSGILDANGVYCDPQLGCSDRLLLVDLSTSESTQFSQEFRLGSDFDGPLNFSLGANFMRHDALDKYYVFINNISLWSEVASRQIGLPCTRGAFEGELAPSGDPTDIALVTCPYLDPNPIGSLNDMGRNYFLSKNPYKLISYAAFGELYYNITPDLKLTGGLRLTVDKKQAPQIPSWLLAGPVDGPYPVTHIVGQEWREPTGRLTLDWKPDLSFTDDTLIYASYAHGYKAGGANPPPPVLATYGNYGATGLEFIPDTFDPEFVDAFEVGTKNTLLDGALTLNLTGFYYDYKSYQVSEIRNRAAVNSNYDAEIWGVEIEADWRPTDYLKLGFKGGYNGTRIADGETSIDLMDRTAGNPDWKVTRPFPSIPSNCILPVYVLTAGNQMRPIDNGGDGNPGKSTNGDCIDAYYNGIDPVTQLPYVANPTEFYDGFTSTIKPLPAIYDDYPGFNPLTAPNNGRGFSKDLGGNELPNAPDFTATVTADYTAPLRGEWLVNLHADVHWQSDSWWRVFNDHEYNRLDEFYVVNLAAIFTNEDGGWKVMAYVKNVLDEDALTGAFLNSDDSGLTTNVFLTEPRLYGLRVSKDWTGSVFGWTGDGDRRTPGEPYPFEVEIGGGLSRFDRSAERYAPGWMTPALTPALAAQDYDLDWGDIRSAKVTYRPANGWSVSGAYLYGRTNGQSRQAAYENVAGATVTLLDGITPKYFDQIDNYAVTAVHDSEEFVVVDFEVGKDIGLGAFRGGTSMLTAGLRYASLKSSSSVATGGVEGSYVAPNVTLTTGVRSHNAYHASLDTERKFEGSGPSASWQASVRLFGDDHGGHADLDWGVGGAVLFGKQTVDSREVRSGVQHRATNGSVADLENLVGYVATPLYDEEDIPRLRTDDVAVPNLSLTLGVSYSIDRLKVSTGYSYDRFFDAIDGGYTETQTYDRTIHGPYLKLSLGFGG